jgi:hypothetical protein
LNPCVIRFPRKKPPGPLSSAFLLAASPAEDRSGAERPPPGRILTGFTQFSEGSGDGQITAAVTGQPAVGREQDGVPEADQPGLLPT